MSINKAQGQSLERVGLILEESVFAHGQLYAALSHAGAFRNVKLLVTDSDKHGSRAPSDELSEGTYTDNIVYKDILLQQSSPAAPCDAGNEYTQPADESPPAAIPETRKTPPPRTHQQRCMLQKRTTQTRP